MAAVSNLAHGLGLAVTAEGVETQEQHDIIAGIGCDLAQGFLYSHAVPASEVVALVRGGLSRAPTGSAGPAAAGLRS